MVDACPIGWDYQHIGAAVRIVPMCLGGPCEDGITIYTQLHPHLSAPAHKVRYLHYPGAPMWGWDIVPTFFWCPAWGRYWLTHTDALPLFPDVQKNFKILDGKTSTFNKWKGMYACTGNEALQNDVENLMSVTFHLQQCSTSSRLQLIVPTYNTSAPVAMSDHFIAKHKWLNPG